MHDDDDEGDDGGNATGLLIAGALSLALWAGMAAALVRGMSWLLSWQ